MSSSILPLSLVLALVTCVGFFDGIGQGAVFGEAAQMPSTYTHVSWHLLSLNKPYQDLK